METALTLRSMCMDISCDGPHLAFLPSFCGLCTLCHGEGLQRRSFKIVSPRSSIQERRENLSLCGFSLVNGTGTFSRGFTMSTVQVGNNHREGDLELFNANILDRLSLARIEGLLIRPLRASDYDKGFLPLLAQLTEVGNVSREQFLNRFHMMKNAGGYYIIVVEDLNTGKIIASATLVAEQKFIHNCALRGRLEDVVVNNNYRGKHLGKLVVTVVLQLARYLHCYKLSLDCQDRLIPFYESLGFKREANNANYLNMRFPNETTAEQSHL